MNTIKLYILKNTFFLFLLVAVVSSCKKTITDNNNTSNTLPGNAFPIPSSSPITGNVSGLVVDENNRPVNGAEVKIGNVTSVTGSNGIFNFNNVVIDKYVSTVTVSYSGYFKAYRSFCGTTKRNFVSIKMLPKTLSGNFNSASNKLITLANGTTINFQANSVKLKTTDAAYNGIVNVYAHYINPTSSDIALTVPGSFMGNDGNNMYMLRSGGMIAVELESESGQSLQLVSTKPATINMPIPASLLNKAPATIDTWSLNEQGVWIKESTANRVGNNYEMAVTHFSFWNIDAPCNAVYLTLNVVDQNGNPLPNFMVELKISDSTSNWGTSYGITNSEGVVSGLVPATLAMQMAVNPNPLNCPATILSQNIGPFTSNTTLTVTVNIPVQQSFTISGTASGCNNIPLANGIAIINSGLNLYTVTSIVNGQYSASLYTCGNNPTNVSVTVIDSTTNLVDSSGSVSVSSNSVIIPDINICNSNTVVINSAADVWDAHLNYKSDNPANANTNTGSLNELPIYSWTVFGAPVTGRVLIGFNLSSLPSTCNIVSAKLSLFGMPPNFQSMAMPQGNSGDNVLLLQRVTQQWDEATVTWNNQPTSTNSNEIEIPASTSTWDYHVIDVDVTNHVQSMLGGNNYGFMLKLKTEATYRSFGFMSSDYADITRRPFLKIVYQN